MSIKFDCPHCRKALNVKDHLGGKKAQCPGCKKVIVIPAPIAAPADLEDFAASALADGPAKDVPKETPNVELKCPYCDEKVAFASELAGKQAPCPECRRIIKIPALEKKDPKDWRTVEKLPTGARRDLGPAPEGTWDAGSVGVVSKRSLVEAKAVPTVKEKVPWQTQAKRAAYLAAALGLVGIGFWFYRGWAERNRESAAFAAGLHGLESARLSADGAGAIQRLAGEYLLAKGQADDARKRFQESRALLLQPGVTSLLEIDAGLTDLALAQAELGGEKPEIDRGGHIAWDTALNDLRPSLETIRNADARHDALRLVVRKLCAKGQSARASPLATVVPQDVVAAMAVVGLEQLRAGNKVDAETLAHNATQLVASGQGRTLDPKAKKPVPFLPPELIALWTALEMPARLKDLMPQPEPNSPPPTGPIVGAALGLAETKEFALARQKAREIPTVLEKVVTLIALAELEAEVQPADAKADLEEASKLAEAELKDQSLPVWQTYKAARLASALSDDELALAWSKRVPDAGLRGRAQLARFQAELAKSRGPAAEAALLGVEKDTNAFGLCVEALARQTARHGDAGSYARGIPDLSPERVRPFAWLGVARGLAEKTRQNP